MRATVPPRYFWRCLCRGLRLQITRITPLRRTILQCSQIFFTDERTFMGLWLPYLYRYTIRPRLRSYGESSTVTLSPGRILMKCIRILPEMCASTLWPFSSSTRNIAFGSGSTTVPSTWMPSSFARVLSLSLGHRTALGPPRPDRYRMLELSAQRTVPRHHCPAIGLGHDFGPPDIHHRLDRKHLAGHEPRAPLGRS